MPRPVTHWPVHRRANDSQPLTDPADLVAVLGVVLAVLIGLGLAKWSPGTRDLLIAANGIACLAPVVWRIFSGRFNAFEPMLWISLALTVMFFVRPIALLRYGVFEDSREVYNIRSTFDLALLSSLVGIVGIQVAYFLPLGRAIANQLPSVPREMDDQVAVRLSWGLILLGLLGYTAFALQAGYSPLALLEGGVAGSQNVSTAYLYNAPFVCIPAVLFLIYAGLSHRRPLLMIPTTVLTLVLIYSLAPSGQRLWLVLLVGSLAIYPILRGRWRPSAPIVALLLVPTLWVVASMRDVGASSQSPAGLSGLIEEMSRTAREPGNAWRELMTGPDTEMFTMLAVERQVVPSALPFQPGQIVKNTLFQAVPREIYKNKPFSADGIINEYLYGSRFNITAHQNASATSIIGVLHYDGGYIAILIGMMFLGVVARAIWEYYRRQADVPLAQMLFASMLPLTVVILRGNPGDTLGRAFFTVLPILIVGALAAGRHQRHG